MVEILFDLQGWPPLLAPRPNQPGIGRDHQIAQAAVLNLQLYEPLSDSSFLHLGASTQKLQSDHGQYK